MGLSEGPSMAGVGLGCGRGVCGSAWWVLGSWAGEKGERGVRCVVVYAGRPARKKGAGGDVLSHPVSRAVPSALRGLTTVFGMGTGVSPAL